MIQSIIFIVVAAVAVGIASKAFLKIRRNILLGQDVVIEGDTGERWKNVALVAFGQKKMFKRILPAVFHLFIYVAFLMTQVELIEIFIDGIFHQHRFFAPMLGGLYTFIINFIEILSVLAFIATFVFLARRNLLKIPRFQKPEMNGWPKLDGNLILLFELILLVGIFSMNGADAVLQDINPAYYHDTGNLLVSSNLGPALFGGLSESTLVGIERFGWWLHILMVFVFLNYLPYSKHLHIFLAFPNTYFAKLQPKGEMDNMPEVMNEVKSMMGLTEGGEEEMDMDAELPEFGAKDVTDLSWRNILQAYSCTECGRCTSVCPANITGKKLSPRKIVMDVRDRAEEIGKNLDSGNPEFIREDLRGDGVTLTQENYDDGKSLFDYISREEIHACTTCNACVEACPILINPLDPILKLRRYEILTESAGPRDWLPMFNSVESGGAVWQMPDDRDKWAQELRD
ncbi:MAG: 4Fe-4S dicluster domain-containing protein [Saprospiraceae bacterium]